MDILSSLSIIARVLSLRRQPVDTSSPAMLVCKLAVLPTLCSFILCVEAYCLHRLRARLFSLVRLCARLPDAFQALSLFTSFFMLSLSSLEYLLPQHLQTCHRLRPHLRLHSVSAVNLASVYRLLLPSGDAPSGVETSSFRHLCLRSRHFSDVKQSAYEQICMTDMCARGYMCFSL